MRSPRRHFRVEAGVVGPALAALRTELSVPDGYQPEAALQAEGAATRGPTLPPGVRSGWQDRRDIPLVTVDPADSTDLDQALHVERRGGGGYRLHYAIADVAAFVTPGGPLDAEVWRRGLTLYLPGEAARLHPSVLSDRAASLLAGVDRPAVLWEIDLDDSGALLRTRVARAMVRSRAKLSYHDAQRVIDDGDDPLALLRTVGLLRQSQEVARGGVSLQLPEQDVVAENGRYGLQYRVALPVEGWNAQMSLLTGMAAAQLMGEAGTGVLRVLPPAEPRALQRLRRSALALGVDWPEAVGYPQFVRGLDPAVGTQAALLQEAARTLRGADYVVLKPTSGVNADVRAAHGDVPMHHALAAPYAHVTAPLRRLVDRYACEVAVALCAGQAVPGWVADALDALPAAMRAAGQRSSQLDRAVLDLMEALVLRNQTGGHFRATVIDADATRSKVQLDNPAVVATVSRPLDAGATVELVLRTADPTTRRVEFDVVD